MKEILKILGNYRFVKKEFFLTVITRTILSIILLYLPILTKKVYEVIEKKGSLQELYYTIGIMAIFSLLAVAITLLSNVYQARLWLNLYVKKGTFYRKLILEKNYKDILNIGTGKLLTRLESGVSSEVNIFTKFLKIAIDVIFRGILVLVIISFYMPEFIFIIIIASILIYLSIKYLKKYIDKYYKLEQENWEEDGRNRAKLVMEQLVINLYGKKEYELNKNMFYLEKASKYGIKADIANETFYKLVDFFVRVAEIFILIIVGGIIITTGKYQLSYLIMLTWYLMFLWEPLSEAITNINEINKAWQKYSKLQEFIEKPNDIINGKDEYIYKAGKIEFKNIDFAYSKEKQIFNDFSLNFLEGKKNALVGHSGGGKSTITKLILRLYDIQKGEILLDGQEIKTLDINSFYREIGYLPQEPAIFDGTIRENMEYAFDENGLLNNVEMFRGNIGKEKDMFGQNISTNKENLIRSALKKAKIDDMIKGLEKGLDTEVGEKGIKLSGGEKQRLAIARIFLKNPKIIILDEPTSALDSISEAKVVESLDELTKGKTSIIIAHRLQTVMKSDKIIVIENGKIESQGSHSELINKSETYKTLVDLQNGKILE